jgi:hypothetical protein
MPQIASKVIPSPSFIKYLLMDWAGKNARDIVMMLSALGLLTVSVLGLLVFLKKV